MAIPVGPVAIGWPRVEETMERAAANYRDGRATGFETLVTYSTPELAYLVEVEHFEAKVGGQPDVASVTLRVTTVVRPEEGGWRIVHRHADPITAPRGADSVVQR